MGRLLCIVLVLGLAGCSSMTPDASTEVDVTGTVTNAAGAPVKDVELYFQATGKTARQATFRLGAQGKFSGKMSAGTYTYLFNELDGKAAAFKAIPPAFQKGDMGRQIEVKGGDIALQVR